MPAPNIFFMSIFVFATAIVWALLLARNGNGPARNYARITLGRTHMVAVLCLFALLTAVLMVLAYWPGGGLVAMD